MATDGDHIGNTKRDYTSVSIEDKDETLANSITKKLPTVSPLSAKCCIFRVLEVLRRPNERVYEPDVVAIGPYHRKKKSLQPMEDVKKWYLRDLLSRTNTSMPSLIKGIKGFVTHASDCYQKPIDVDDENEFMEIMIIDGCFLIELFRKEAYFNLRSMDDPIFNMTRMHKYLYRDLLLLENQIPWFIIETLFELTMPNDHRNFIRASLGSLVLEFFSVCFPFIGSYELISLLSEKENLHILDLIRDVTIIIPSSSGTKRIKSISGVEQSMAIPCVTVLLEAGVKFKKGSPGSIMNIKFTNGIFEIPPLLINETTEPMFRNLIAFEQCYHGCDHKITSYAVLMDNLINTGKDVEYLAGQGIIDNWLSDEKASQFFNQLYNDTLLTRFYYDELFKSVNKFNRMKWPKWRAALIHQYSTLIHQYSTAPWTIISLIAGVILLVLTFLQTYYSIK